MRQVNGSILSNLQVRQGLEPIVIIGITWGGATYLFSSKYGFYGRTNIIAVGNCSHERKTDSRSNSGSASISFDDSDGFLKSVIDQVIVEKAPAKIFLAFDNDDSFILMMNGRVTGPVSYSEGDRILSLSIETEVETKEVGFAPTDEFNDLSPEAIGVPWPMIFGKVAHVPAVHVRKRREGTLKTPIRLKSDIFKVNNDNKKLLVSEDCHVYSYLGGSTSLDVMYIRDGDLFPQGTKITISIDGVHFRGKFAGEIFTVEESNVPTFTNITFLARGGMEYGENSKYLARLPVGKNLTGHYIYLGTSNPALVWSNYIVKQEGQICEFRHIPINPQSKLSEFISQTRTIDKAYPIMKNGLVGEAATILESIIQSIQKGLFLDTKDRAGLVKSLTEKLAESTEIFWQAPADTIVRLVGEDPDIYIVSCVQCASIDGVYGHKNYTFPDGKSRKVLAPIPKEYYTVQLQSNYPVNDAFASALLFDRPLKDYSEEGWGDRIFVTATSTIGPNVSDILFYILNTYAPELNPVKSTFNRLDDDLDPANFAYSQRKSALDFAAEVAWQARCALRIDSERVELILVDERPNSILILNESNTLRDSLNLGFTPISEIKTKFVCRWSITHKDHPTPTALKDTANQQLITLIKSVVDNDSDSKMDERVTVYRENVDVYGERTEDVNIFIFNDEDSINRTLAFWGHRAANSWRTIQLTTFLNATHVQPFDLITLAHSNNIIANLNSMPAIVNSFSLDFKDKTVSLNLWLPSISGTENIDSDAWST